MKKGYSTLEIAIVVIVISVFISVIFSRYKKIEDEAKIRVRNTEIQILQYNLQIYKIKNGRYPHSISELLNSNIIDNETIQILNNERRLKGNILYDPFEKPYSYDNVTGRVW
ncbi:MAG: type II secretion system protein GspG [Calditerrivibrio sp.]|nr:type II secretion system protein GspG [Calditerrivibrio sp.]MCA1980262.1 type II secretion system protein GspG [Calditerrivibrio sp.]